MDKIRISAVKYANTWPFLYGLKKSGLDKKVILETDHPSECAAKLADGRVDVGLIPVAALPLLKEYHIITDFCLGANGNVRTVMLFSNCPFDSIETVYLDYRSRSSVSLARILASHCWGKKFQWRSTSAAFDFTGLKNGEAVVLIGDQCFEFEDRFTFRRDLAGAWKEFTGLPFVFACWAANRKLDEKFIFEFNEALRSGMEDIDAVINMFGQKSKATGSELRRYLTENMNYEFNETKKKALELFLGYIKTLNPSDVN